MIKVAILFGGSSAEHDISILSAKSILRTIDLKKYIPIPVGLTRQGDIASIEELQAMLGELSHMVFRDLHSKSLEVFKKFDIIFPVLHGPFGEDGSVQGYLEWIDVPYVGCGVLASALCMDKVMFKKVIAYHCLPFVPYESFQEFDWQESSESISQTIHDKLGYPIFIKPANMGSSLGISKVLNQNQLSQALVKAFKYDSKVILEKAFQVRELEVSLLGNPEDIRVSELGEIIPFGEFYDYSSKYETSSEIHIPAPLKVSIKQQIQKHAQRVFQVLGCTGLARVDFFLDQKERIYINEVNTMPGFTSISMYPKLWESQGISNSSLIDELIQLGLSKSKKPKLHSKS